MTLKYKKVIDIYIYIYENKLHCLHVFCEILYKLYMKHFALCTVALKIFSFT